MTTIKPQPALLFVEHTLANGDVASLALIRTHWATEGSCLVEITDPNRHAAKVVANGVWRKLRGPQGASLLDIEIDNPGVDSWGELIDMLMAAAVDDGSFGVDAFQPHGDM